MKTKRILSLLLAALTAAAVFASCGESSPDAPRPETTAPDAAVTDAAATETETEELPDLPENLDYNGYDFRVIARGTGKWTCQDMYAAEMTGEVLNDAVLERNRYVEDALHFTISQQLAESDAKLYSAISQAILAGEDAYDLLWVNSTNIAKLSMAGLLADLAAVENLDLSHSWWDSRAVQNLRVNGCVYFTTGDISVIGNYATYVISFNKTLHTKYGLDDLYAIVRSGAWDYDCFETMAKSITADLDGNGTYDEHDLYGFMTYGSDYNGFLLSTGSSFARIDGDSITTNYNNETAITVLEKLAALHGDQSCYFFRSDDVANEIFVGGRTLFCFRTLINLNFYRDMETDYGILPTPKADEKQENYNCGVHAYGLSLIGLPVTSPDTARTGAILEMLAWKSKELVTPAFYDKTLKGKYFRDEESAEMLDIVFESRLYDLGYFGNWGQLPSKLESQSAANKGDFASLFASCESAVADSLNDTVAAYSALR